MLYKVGRNLHGFDISSQDHRGLDLPNTKGILTPPQGGWGTRGGVSGYVGVLFCFNNSSQLTLSNGQNSFTIIN
jgi:hypothetical protein